MLTLSAGTAVQQPVIHQRLSTGQQSTTYITLVDPLYWSYPEKQIQNDHYHTYTYTYTLTSRALRCSI